MDGLGDDASKSKIDVAVLVERSKIKSHVLDNSAKGFSTLIAWLLQFNHEQPLNYSF